MKFLTIFLLLSTASFAQSTQNQKVGSPPNAVSRGQAENSGISDSPAGVTQEEVQEERARAESMGGAPNAGAGTATGTGAGSTVGHKIKDADENQ